MATGRKPIPTALKILNGNPGRRPLNVDEPKLPDLDPAVETTVPPELAGDEIGTAYWLFVMPILRASRCVTEGERQLCIALCQQWGLYQVAQKIVAVEGMMVRSATDTPHPHPAYQVASRALSHCTKLWVELGLTPAARTRVRAVGVSTKSPAEREREDYFGGVPKTPHG